MYTQNTYRTIVFVVNLAWYLGILHYRFVSTKDGSSKSQRKYTLVVDNSKFRIRLIKVTLIIGSFYDVYLLGRILHRALLAEETEETKATFLQFIVVMTYLFWAYFLPIVIHSNVVMKQTEKPRLMDQFFSFYGAMREKYLIPGEKGSSCRQFILTFLIVGNLVIVQNTIFAFKKPMRPEFFTSVFEDPKAVPIIYRLPLTLLHIFTWIWIFVVIWIQAFILFSYITSSLYLIREMDARVKRPRTFGTLREPFIAVKVLRSMQVLHRLFTETYQHWYMPAHKAGTTSVITLALYGVVKLSGPRSIIMGLVCVIGLLYISALFYKFGQLHEKSKSTLRNWKSHPGATKWMRKWLSSVPTFSVKIGHFYKVERTTVVMTLWHILNNTITLFFL